MLLRWVLIGECLLSGAQRTLAQWRCQAPLRFACSGSLDIGQEASSRPGEMDEASRRRRHHEVVRAELDCLLRKVCSLPDSLTALLQAGSPCALIAAALPSAPKRASATARSPICNDVAFLVVP